jgi:glutamyl-tRNA synthetase
MTHVIRGDDHVANTPRQILLYQALDAPLPEFAHVPLILGLDKARLSKRHGATSVTQYRADGYLPHALVNFLARLGWSHGDQEIFARAELIEHFGLEQVGKAAAVFNPEKLLWLNFQYLKATPAAQLADLVCPFLEQKGLPVPNDKAWLARAVETLRERAKTLVELADFLRFYVTDDIEPAPKAAAEHLKPEIASALADLTRRLESVSPWEPAAIEQAFHQTMDAHHLALGKLAQPVRVAVTGGTVSPGIFEVLDVLGRERTISRLRAALARLRGAPAASAP